eukprot:5716745-Pyramimonas_sp.AAC.1
MHQMLRNLGPGKQPAGQRHRFLTDRQPFPGGCIQATRRVRRPAGGSAEGRHHAYPPSRRGGG